MGAKKKKNARATKKAAGGMLAKLQAALMAIAEPAAPPIPVDHLVAEGRAIAKVAAKHEKDLRRTGIDGKLLASVDARATALSEAQSDVALRRRAKRSAAEQALEREAVELRSELVADGRFALRNDVDAQAAIDHIQEGEGLDDLVQDLRDLAQLAKRHRAPLAKAGVNVDAKAKSALALAAKLEELVALRRAGNAEERLALDLRDRAATYLVEAMREIRAAGAYAFRKQPEIAARFRGAYEAQKRASKAKRKPQPAAPPPAAGGNGQAVSPSA